MLFVFVCDKKSIQFIIIISKKMAYFEYFAANVLNTNAEAIKGICTEMCPQEEVSMREKERLVHVLEVNGQERKLVKSYSRSAADTRMAVPRLLRPYPVLKETVSYLLFHVTKRNDVPERVVYDFVDDRLRAARQDMIIQRFSPDECMCLLEPMVRFYIYYGYKLHHCSREFDPVLNKKHLLECLKWFLSCSERSKSMSETNICDVLDRFSCLNIDSKPELTCDRVLMESLYILCNLDNLHPLHRYLQLPKNLKSDPTMQLAYRIGTANLLGNYVKVCRLITPLCPLTRCALLLYLPTLQRRALLVMSHAYNSGMLSVPHEALRRWLQYSGRQAADACSHYGLHIGNEVTHFRKTAFRIDQATFHPKNSTEDIVKETTDYIFTYTTRK